MKPLPWLEPLLLRWQRPKARAPIAAPMGVTGLPRPALRWVGVGGRVAVRPFDWAADSDVVCQWQRETYGLNFPEFEFTESFAAAFRHDLRRASIDGQHGLFVLDDGQPCGFLWLVMCQNNWTSERYGYINNIYIAPSRRGQQLGAALMQQAQGWFKNRKVKRIRLTVTSSNAAACHLYESQGFATVRWEMEKEL